MYRRGKLSRELEEIALYICDVPREVIAHSRKFYSIVPMRGTKKDTACFVFAIGLGEE